MGMEKNCVVCGKPFQASCNKITCSVECGKKRHAQKAEASRPPDYFERYNEVNKDVLRVQRRNYRRSVYQTTSKRCGLTPVVCPECGKLGRQYIHTAINKNTGYVYTLIFIRHKSNKKIVEHYCSKKCI